MNNLIYENCIIGLGPAGVGVISELTNSELKNTICLEKGSLNGECISHNNKDLKCTNCKICRVISGIGGASHFSCGKLSDFPAGSGLKYFFDSEEELKKIFEKEICLLSKQISLKKYHIDKPYIETDLSKDKDLKFKFYDVYEFRKDEYLNFLKNIINKAETNGLTLRFDSKVVDVQKNENDDYYCVKYIQNNKNYYIKSKKIIIATGNFAEKNDLLNIKLGIVRKSYEVGVRIEFPTSLFDDILSTHGDLKIKYKNGRTYCVSKNGNIMGYCVDGMMFLEGVSDDGNQTDMTNLSLIFKSDDSDSLNALLDKYKTKFKGIPIVQTYDDYLNNKPSSINRNLKYLNVQSGNINELFSDYDNKLIMEFIKKLFPCIDEINKKSIYVYALELKYTNDVSIEKNFQIKPNLYLIGSATGKYRGILQSYISGKYICSNLRR